jgi:hypothetical protein
MAGVIQFLHTLFLFPDIAERVFEEIQSVTQGHRLPTIGDRPHLPFTEAAWKEALRWRPVIPIGKKSCLSSCYPVSEGFIIKGVPHVSSQDEIVKGYFIPKGAIIYQNIRLVVCSFNIFTLTLNDPE